MAPCRSTRRCASSTTCCGRSAQRTALGIVHRDVKPGNVLLTSDGTAKLADFGIAKRSGDGDLTLAGQFVGTPEYLSPEQVSGGEVTPSTDLYAAGVVLFEALAGSPPFAAGSPLATALAHRDMPPPDIRTRRRNVPDHVAGVVSRAMEKNPARRFASAEEMRGALAGRVPAPVVLAPTMVMPRRTATRRWWWLAGAVAVAVAGVVVALDAVGDPEGAPPSTTSAATTVPATTTTSTTTTTTTPTTTTTTVPPVVETPAAVDDLLLLIDVAPVMFGEHADEIRRSLEQIAEHGRQRDVERLQDRVAEWSEEGSLPNSTAAIIEAVLADLGDDNDNDDE